MCAVEVVRLISIERACTYQPGQLVGDFVTHLAKQRVLLRRVSLELSEDRLDRNVPITLRVARCNEGLKPSLNVLLKHAGYESRAPAEFRGEPQLVCNVLTGIGLV